ncbi:hypothetical protein PP707_08165, partial [Acetobacter pasteurianus]|nr:hypothetical protein [Acetobacter pasteurianus]
MAPTQSQTNGKAFDGEKENSGLNSTTTIKSPADSTSPQKQIKLFAFEMGCSGLQAPGLWKHPRD